MKFFATIMGAALVATGVSAQQAVVKNNCASPIYVQSFPFDGSATGPLTTVQPGQSFSEDFRQSGSVSTLHGQTLMLQKQKAKKSQKQKLTHNVYRPSRSPRPGR